MRALRCWISFRSVGGSSSGFRQETRPEGLGGLVGRTGFALVASLVRVKVEKAGDGRSEAIGQVSEVSGRANKVEQIGGPSTQQVFTYCTATTQEAEARRLGVTLAALRPQVTAAYCAVVAQERRMGGTAAARAFRTSRGVPRSTWATYSTVRAPGTGHRPM